MFRRARAWHKSSPPANPAQSISIEVPELLECFQWSELDYNLTNVSHEMADVYIYLLTPAHELKIDLCQGCP